MPVPDERLDRVADTLGIERRVPEQIEFVDIAGLVRGAHKGEGLGNRFLGHIRDVDAILHVVRAFEHPQVAHPHGELDPVADLETVETELLLADLETRRAAARGRERRAGGGEREARAEAELLASGSSDGAAGGQAGAAGGRPADLEAGARGRERRRGRGRARQRSRARSASRSAPSTRRSCASSSPTEAAAMRAELGLAADALERRSCAPPTGCSAWSRSSPPWATNEVRARSLAQRQHGASRRPAGSTPTCSAGFVRAEVIGWEELVEAGSFARARELGRLRTEGRDYVVAGRRRA